MIRLTDLAEVGRTLKPHGINGEISAAISDIVDLDTARCIVLDVDGIFVPFFIDSWRSRGSEAVLLTIDGVDDEKCAQSLCGKVVYVLREDLSPVDEDADTEGMYVDDMVGFTVLSPDGGVIGGIASVDTSTVNTLFVVNQTNGGVVYIPVADEFIAGLDPEARTITMDLPDGLLEL